MERMAEPCAVHERLERVAGFAEDFVAARDNLLKEIGDRLQPALPVDETVNDVIEHRRLLSPGQARENSIGLLVELQPARQPSPGTSRLGQVDTSESNCVARTRLRQH